MFPPHAWSLYIKIFGVVILIAACVTLGLSFWHGTVNWLSIVVSIVYLCLGAMGVYSGWKQSHFSAVLFFGGCLVALALTIMTYLTEIIYINNWVNDYCNEANISGEDCHSYRNFRWVFAVCGIISAIPACCCFIFFAYGFMLSLDTKQKPDRRLPTSPPLQKNEEKLSLLSDFT